MEVGWRKDERGERSLKGGYGLEGRVEKKI
jgi:hypothetical protein